VATVPAPAQEVRLEIGLDIVPALGQEVRQVTGPDITQAIALETELVRASSQVGRARRRHAQHRKIGLHRRIAPHRKIDRRNLAEEEAAHQEEHVLRAAVVDKGSRADSNSHLRELLGVTTPTKQLPAQKGPLSGPFAIYISAHRRSRLW
jgi:hypothetical protein